MLDCVDVGRGGPREVAHHGQYDEAVNSSLPHLGQAAILIILNSFSFLRNKISCSRRLRGAGDYKEMVGAREGSLGLVRTADGSQ